jgi:hypothetical protein
MYKIKCLIHVLFLMSLFVSIEGCGIIRSCGTGFRQCSRVAEEVGNDPEKSDNKEESKNKDKNNQNE